MYIHLCTKCNTFSTVIAQFAYDLYYPLRLVYAMGHKTHSIYKNGEAPVWPRCSFSPATHSAWRVSHKNV